LDAINRLTALVFIVNLAIWTSAVCLNIEKNTSYSMINRKVDYKCELWQQ